MTLLSTLFGFTGRINRSTFWLCALALLLIDAAVMMLVQGWAEFAYPGAVTGRGQAGGAVLAVGLPMLLVAVASVWAGLALKVKRLHDRNRSGLWLLVALTGVGVLWLFWEIGLAPGIKPVSDMPTADPAAPAEVAEEEPPSPAAPVTQTAFADSEPVPDAAAEAAPEAAPAEAEPAPAVSAAQEEPAEPAEQPASDPVIEADRMAAEQDGEPAAAEPEAVTAPEAQREPQP